MATPIFLALASGQTTCRLVYKNGAQVDSRTCFGSTYTKIGTIQRRLAWPLRKDDTQNREAFHIFCQLLFLKFRFVH